VVLHATNILGAEVHIFVLYLLRNMYTIKTEIIVITKRKKTKSPCSSSSVYLTIKWITWITDEAASCSPV